MPHNIPSLSDIGPVAARILRQDQDLRVDGRTSRGAYLSSPDGWTLFLTSDTNRGPLTINISPDGGSSLTLDGHPSVRVESGALVFNSSGFNLTIEDDLVWSPAGRPPIVLPPQARIDRWHAIAQKVSASKESEGCLVLLSNMIQLLKDSTSNEADEIRRLRQLHSYLQYVQIDDFCISLESFLGLGGGLTPAGDDFILGILLALNRWGSLLAPAMDIPELNRRIRAAAYQRTTTLSANLIDCATQGLADEGLMIALDSFFSGYPDEDFCAGCFSNWGNSSGSEVLAGFGLVFSAELQG